MVVRVNFWLSVISIFSDGIIDNFDFLLIIYIVLYI